MSPELGGSQISALLESVPGIANVLRSPVADALVDMIRAGAGVGEFYMDDARELVQYAVRRGLINADEGETLLEEVVQAVGKRRARKTKPKKKLPKKPAGQKKKPFGRSAAAKKRQSTAPKKTKTKKKARKSAKRTKRR